jgi:hypothetical protein
MEGDRSMDPVTLILSALMAGAAASVKETASAAVKDGYNGLKELIQRKFGGNADAQHALSKYEQKPEVWQAPLAEEIKQGGLAQDQELLVLAQQLMAQLHPQQAALGKYNIQTSGSVQGMVVGDHASQQNVWNGGQSPREEHQA